MARRPRTFTCPIAKPRKRRLIRSENSGPDSTSKPPYYADAWRRPGGFAGWTSANPLNATPVTATTYQDTTVSPLTTYYYVVSAVYAAGTSDPSNEASATTSDAAGADLVLFHPAFASSLENSSFPASNAGDGNSATRWSSQFSDPQWIYVDVGAVYNITELKLNWEHAAGKDYQIQVSFDAANWTTIATITGRRRPASTITPACPELASTSGCKKNDDVSWISTETPNRYVAHFFLPTAVCDL